MTVGALALKCWACETKAKAIMTDAVSVVSILVGILVQYFAIVKMKL